MIQQLAIVQVGKTMASCYKHLAIRLEHLNTFAGFFRVFIRSFRAIPRISCSVAGPCVRLRNNAFHCTNHPLFGVVRQGGGWTPEDQKTGGRGGKIPAPRAEEPPQADRLSYPQPCAPGAPGSFVVEKKMPPARTRAALSSYPQVLPTAAWINP